MLDLFQITYTLKELKDLYHFPNQKELIEKRYNYDVDADFYKKVLDKNVYEEISKKKQVDCHRGRDF